MKGTIDDKLATLRHAIEEGVKADSMQSLKLMELVDDIGDRFKRELDEASGTEPELPTGWKAAPPIMTAAMSQAWADAMRDGKPTWPAVLAAMPSTDAAGDPALYMRTPAPQQPVAWENPSTYAILRDESPDMCDTRRKEWHPLVYGNPVAPSNTDATAEREAFSTLAKALGYPWLPCPICNGTEGCDHSVPERARAALATTEAPMTDAIAPTEGALTAAQKWEIAERVHAQCERLKPHATFRSAASQAINDTLEALCAAPSPEAPAVDARLVNEVLERQQAGFERCFEALGIADDKELERGWSSLVLEINRALSKPAVDALMTGYRRGIMEAFHLANMTNANRQGRTAEETLTYLLRKLVEIANGGENVARPASKLDDNTRGILSDALAMYARHHRMAAAQRQSIEFALDRLAAEQPA